MRELLIRADASASLGTGHVMRSLAFAEAAAEAGIPVRFVLGGDGLAVTWVNRRSFDAQYRSDPLDRAWLDSTTEGSVVLVDGLHFADELYASVAESPAHLVVMEDISGIRYADAIVTPRSTGTARGRADVRFRSHLSAGRFANRGPAQTISRWQGTISM